MKNIHFIAIGGAIMHQLALALQRQGYTVTEAMMKLLIPLKAICRRQACCRKNLAGSRTK